MNLLYLSHLSNNVFAGPNYSVPAGIKAQQKYDNCFWINLTDSFQPHWGHVEAYHNYTEFGEKEDIIYSLPSPFNAPDVVIFEGFYNEGLFDPFLAKALINRHIPYVIVPRGSLTRQAMNNHGWLKKRVAHLLFFDSYCKHALAIQFLTEQEYLDSFKNWNDNHIIIPNGFDRPNKNKASFSKQGLKMLFMGRPDKYHKGLDVLWKSMIEMRDELLQSQVTLDFYAPKGRYDYDWLERQIKAYHLESIITMHDKIEGKDKEDALLASDLFIMTSRFEGQPMGLIEALAYGIPVLVSPGTNMAKEIREANAGWVTDCDTKSIKVALQTLIREKYLLAEKGRCAGQLATQYNWDNIAKDFHNQIQRLLKQQYKI